MKLSEVRFGTAYSSKRDFKCDLLLNSSIGFLFAQGPVCPVSSLFYTVYA
jgi:hypothetical protein